MNRLGTAIAAACFALTLASGCAAEYVHDPNAFYPADFETSYTKISTCAKSGDHSGSYVESYANAMANTAFMDTTTTEYPVGAVIVKAQYDSSDCSGGYASLTAMRKDAEGAPDTGNWKWQRIADSGEIEMDTYAAASCFGCHASGNDYVRTTP